MRKRLREALRCRRAVRIDEITTLERLLAAVPKVRLVMSTCSATALPNQRDWVEPADRE
jgi:hypothetical protein